MVETGHVIHGRYLLQRLLKQGQCCAVYQSSDQVLQRNVVVKIVPAEHIPAYRAALRATSQFAHPNIIGIYDLIVEPDKLYIVQEYVEGDDFAALLQSQQSAYQVADMGLQICQALIYAGGAAHKISHGDLTPASLIRDIRGQIRLNNFALPSDIYYFTSWSVVGGDGRVVSDRELAWGKTSDGRKEDDARAVGLLMYQLLMSRTPGLPAVEPPTDGRLRFTRNVPAELCEVVARAIIRQHPQHITSAEDLHKELKPLAELLEPPVVVSPVPVPVHAQVNELAAARAFSGTGHLGGPSGPLHEGSAQAGLGLSAYAAETVQGQSVAVDTTGVSDLSMKLNAARQAAYPQESLTVQPRAVNLPVLLGVGLVLFALFFVFGYFIANAVIH
ncbi:MAG TPA: protein kinase [Ktedonobacteraceae bacterium]|jgi:hypothetical protein|nr:protein kinase [Ktedonobacteraceae bacterium]